MAEHHYHHDKRSKRRRWIKRLVLTLIVLLLLALLVLGILFLTTSLFVQKEQEPVTSTVQNSVQAPSTKIFRTQYFQFQTGDTWAEDAKETTDNKFVYRSYRGPLVEHDLTIYVNPASNNIDGTRVQPVKPLPNGTFEVPEGISAHCDTSLSKEQKDQAQVVTYKGVRFMCDADDTIFEVLVGAVKGTPFMELRRPNGTTATYLIVYRDLTALPTGSPLKAIVNSFQTR